MTDEQATFWSAIADRYDRIVDQQLGGATRAAVRARLAREGRLGRTVELGCGTGFFTGVLAEKAESVLATDLSPGMLDVAGRVGAGNVTFQVADCQRTSLPDASFDTAFISLVLHFTDPAQTIAEMHRILRPGGTLIVANLDPAPLRGFDRVRAILRILYRGVTGYRVKPPRRLGRNVLTAEALTDLMLRSGFQPAICETITDPACSSSIPIDYVRAVKCRERHNVDSKERNAVHEAQVAAPDNTAVRTALWRALHVEVDAPPHVFEDRIGLQLVAPDQDWRDRPDMGPFTRPFRASIVGRARFVEDLVAGEVAHGVGQYVMLGAGLDTFAQRRPELASRLRVFEIDQPPQQEWKRQRLVDLGFGIPSFLRFVPVDFEAGDEWWERLLATGFDTGRPAVVASTGVSMYLTQDAIAATLRRVATLAPGSTLVMSFMLPIELMDPEVRPGVERAAEGARANGTPFISFFTPSEMLALARDAGSKEVRHVSAAMLAERYFAGRADGLRPPNDSEELLVATT
jgi:methyltransferase (TIGR00027 family)